MTSNLQIKAYEIAAVLYMAMELSNEKWRLAFGEGTRARQVSIEAGDIVALKAQVAKVKEKWGLAADTLVVSCY